MLLTSTCWRNDHNGFSHQGPGLIDTVMAMSGDVVRVYLPPDANCLLSVANHCLTSRNYVNLIVIDKQPELQYLSMDAAIEHCALGASVWDWASNQGGGEPDVVLGCAGDIPTLETLAAAALLRDRVPDLALPPRQRRGPAGDEPCAVSSARTQRRDVHRGCSPMTSTW